MRLQAEKIHITLSVLMVAAVPFCIIPITAALTAFCIVIPFLTNKQRTLILLRRSQKILIPAYVVLLWVIFAPSEPVNKIAYLEKYLLLFFLPVAAVLMPDTDKSVSRLFARVFVYSTSVLLILTLGAACLNYYTEPSPTGRASDWFFHIQLSYSFLEIHPTYLSITAVASVLFILFTFRPTAQSYLILGFIFVMVVLLFVRITMLSLLTIFVCFIAITIWKHTSVRTILIVAVMIVVAALVIKKVSDTYDYEHRKMLIGLKEGWTRSGIPGVTYTDWGVIVRFAIWRAGFDVFKENPWIGVSPYRESSEISKKLIEIGHPSLAPENFNAHNQLLSLLICYGLVGTVLILISIFLCATLAWTNRNYLYLAGLIFFIIASLTESFLNRACGVTIFAWFNVYALLGMNFQQTTKDEA